MYNIEVYRCVYALSLKFQMPSSSDSCIVISRPRTVENCLHSHHAIILYSKHIALTKITYFFPSLLPCHYENLELSRTSVTYSWSSDKLISILS
jgi:hypothetical protein